MSAPGELIPDWVQTAIRDVLSFVGFVLAGISGLLFRRYREHIAMLLRHEEVLTQNAVEFGQMKVFREQAAKAPIGEELEDVLKVTDEKIEKLHNRISRHRDRQMETEKRVESMATDIRWIRETMERREGK